MNAASALHMSIFGLTPEILHGSEELKRRSLDAAYNRRADYYR